MKNSILKNTEWFVRPRNRIILSRIIAVGIVVLWVTAGSYWQEHHILFASFMFVIGVFLLAMASLGRMWCSVYIAGYKNRKLVTYGPYSMTRNPLYFFSMLGLMGFGFLTKTLIFPVVLTIIFLVYYNKVIQKEQKDLSEFFGEDYEDYKKRVPKFFPKLSLYEDAETYTVSPKTYRKHIMSAIWFVWLIGIVYFIQALQSEGWFPQWALLY